MPCPGSLRYPRFSGAHLPLPYPTPHPAPPLTPTPCALQVAWDPEPESQEDCPVAQVQVLGET